MAEPPHPLQGLEMFLYDKINGGIVNKPELAQKLAELFIERAYDAEELARQLPLKVSDEGDSWLIQGSPTDRKNNLGAAIVRIKKADGGVLNLSIPYHLGR